MNDLFAQNIEKQALDKVLIIFEQRFDVVFSYSNKNIKNIFVIVPNKDLSLNECIVELEKQTNLIFKRIDSRYIAIKKKDNTISINGIVKEKISGDVLASAVISTNNNVSLSDKYGKFSIKVNPLIDSVLTIRYIGCKPLILNQDAWINDSSVYVLEQDFYALNEVVINFIAIGVDKMIDGSIKMNIQNLGVLPGLAEPDVLKSIQVLPGIQSTNEMVADINIRGGTNDQNLVLWDGVKMYQSGHFFGLISAFNSHLVHKTQIIKNGTNASLGGGVSGIIDLKQQEYLVNKFSTDIGLNMISTDVIVRTPVSRKFSLIFGMRHSINNVFITPTYKRYFERAFEYTDVYKNQNSNITDYKAFSFYDLSTKLLYDISDKDKIRFSFLNINNIIEYKANQIINDTLIGKNNSLTQSSLLSNINYTRTWDSNNKTKVNVSLSKYLLDAFNASLTNNQHHIQQNEVLDWGINVTFNNKISKTIKLVNGYEFKEIGIRNLDNIQKPNYYRDIKDVLRIHSLYSEGEINPLLKKLYLRLGLRANYFAKFKKLIIEPRTSINYKINQSFSLEFLAERKSQYTTQQIDFQSDFLGIEKRRWVLSNNSSVPIITSKQLSLGMQYDKNNFLLSAEVYTKKVNGIISPSQGFQNQYQYTYAIGDYNIIGTEWLLDKHFNHFNLWANYSLSNNYYIFNDFIPPKFPNNFDVRHALSIGGRYSFDKIKVSSGFNFRTGKPFTKPLTEDQKEFGEIKYETSSSSRLNDYIRLDISAKYFFNFKNMKGEIGLSVWNVLNRKNEINTFYQRNEQNEIEQVIQHALKMTPNINLRIKF